MLSRCRPLLGTFVEISADREDGIDAAFVAVQQVHRLMSAHDPDSDVSRVNRVAHDWPVEVHGWTALVLERALRWSGASGGAFDAVRAGKLAVERGLIPRHADQPEPVASRWAALEIVGGSVRLRAPACIDLGGIAKGFAVDRAVEALKEAGCERGLVNAGGDLRGFGRVPWPVTIVDPESRQPVAEIDLHAEAIATSAGLPGEDGLSFEHLGGRKARWTSVSVIARTACDADALTKIVWSGIEQACALLSTADARALVLTETGEIELIAETAGAFA